MRLHDHASIPHDRFRSTISPRPRAAYVFAILAALGLAACSGSAPVSPDRDSNAGDLNQTPAAGETPGLHATPSADSTTQTAQPVFVRVITTMPSADDFAAGRILVHFKPGISLAAQSDAHARLGGSFDSTIYGMDVQIVNVPAGQEKARIADYQRDPAVDYAELDFEYAAYLTPNDTSFASKQWDMTKINCQKAWDVTTGLASVKVAVLDTGLDSAHTDVGPKMVGSKNFTSTSTSIKDGHGHGTHCSGTVAAMTNNAKGVAGVGFNSSLLIGKVLSDSGSGYTSWISSGVNWAKDNGAKVISMSLGGGGYSSTMNTAVNNAFNAGVVVIAAAGNSNTSALSYPAAYANCMSVGATTSADKRASYSNYGTWVDLAAPGSSIYSTYKTSGGVDKYATMSGTSMACPHVAGLAALVWASPFGTSASAVRDRLISTGDAIVFDKPIGKRINAARAVGAIP